MKDNIAQDTVNKLLIEIRRGDLVLAALVLLEEPDYGYGLLKLLKDRGLDVSQDTLYPLLRRLEAQGFLTGDWDTRNNRPRKMYRIREECRPIRDRLIEDWKQQKKLMEEILWK